MKSLDLFKCLAQIAFTQVDETAQGRLLEMSSCCENLLWLVFGADDHAVAAGSADSVAYGCSEIERRNAIRGTGLDDAARATCAAKLITEFRLVTVKRDKLVVPKGLNLVLRTRMCVLGPFSIVAPHRRSLFVASGMQAIQQAFQFWIAKNAQGSLTSAAGTLISDGKMIAAGITSRHSAANACSIVTKPPSWYSHATRPTEAPAAVKPTK